MLQHLTQIGSPPQKRRDNLRIMEPSSLLQLPREVRMLILGYLLDVDALLAGKWFAQRAFRINRQIRNEAISVFYGTCDLIFDVPTESYGKWGFFGLRSPVLSQYSTSVKPFLPICRNWRYEHKGRKILKACPFHLFRSIHIEIPKMGPQDLNRLVLAWDRLRWITWLLHQASGEFPPILVEFTETLDKSWYHAGTISLRDSDMTPFSHPRHASEPSGLMLLLGALNALRHSLCLGIQIRAPDPLNSADQGHLEWLSSAMELCKCGHPLHPGSNKCWLKWAESCDQHLDMRVESVLDFEQAWLSEPFPLQTRFGFNHINQILIYALQLHGP